MADAVNLSPYHFARQFKAATGLPPYRFVITRRIERAQHLLRTNGGLALAEIAFRSGFANQSHFSFHFKRIAAVSRRSGFGKSKWQGDSRIQSVETLKPGRAVAQINLTQKTTKTTETAPRYFSEIPQEGVKIRKIIKDPVKQLCQPNQVAPC